MSAGLILLAIVSVLVLFGAAQRVLDRMQLTDRGALIMAARKFDSQRMKNSVQSLMRAIFFCQEISNIYCTTLNNML